MSYSASYQVLARKWRPKNFAEMVGQEHVLRALINALDQQRLHHAYLFTGTRGVGKTTVARVLAKCLNCETGITARPCGQCDTCQEIDRGSFIDLIEVDAASRTKVEDTRELLENVQYAPSRGRFKVYLIDEVHMLSGHSFNALLKTLEEPPEHVKFLLATTDPQKLPVTVLSRCLQFHLKALSLERITAHLKHVLDQEKIACEETALMQIARAANGSMRDALSLLDQAIAFSNHQVFLADVNSMLGNIEQAPIHDLLLALSQQNGPDLLKIIARIAETTPDFTSVLNELLSQLQQLAMAQVISSVDCSLDKNIFSPEEIQLYYQIALIGKRDLAFMPEPRSGFEMIMLRMLAFHPKAPSSTSSSAPMKSPMKETSPALSSHNASTQTRSTAPQQHVAANTSAVNRPAAINSDTWSELLGKLALTGLTQALAQHCAFKQFNDDQLELILAPVHAAMLNDKLRERINAAISQHYARPIKLLIHIETPGVTTPAQQQQNIKDARQTKANQLLNEDPNVQALMQTFGANLQETMPLKD